MKRLIVIGGPTASGKTALSVTLAQTLKTVVISADSRQFYKEMSIGTAKPTTEEMQGIPHYFVDSHSIHNELNASDFAAQAEQLVHQLFETYDTLILTGGSGMFIDALIYGLDDIPHDPAIQQQLNHEFETQGLALLLAELQEKDPTFYQQVDRNNPVRVIRALEVIRITNTTFSSLRQGTKKVHPFQVDYFVIDVPRELLYDRINRRVDLMLENGLEQEVQQLLFYTHFKPLATVGYSEWINYFNHTDSRETCIEQIKQNSRRYAKRQITWFKRNKEAVWIPFASTDEMIKQILN